MPERLAARGATPAAFTIALGHMPVMTIAILLKRLAMALGVVLLSACSSAPTYGPSILVLPGAGKSFDQFRLDEQDCRGYAQSQFVKSTSDQDTAGAPQQRYDRSFVQCMFAKGHRVPISGRVSDYMDSSSSTLRAAAPPPPPTGRPPAEVPPDYRPK